MTPTLEASTLLAIVGPTASGKSALGLEAAQRLRRPILVCDSVKIYRWLDIGSAKPSAAARAKVPHHLIDLVPPDAAFSAGDWARAAERQFVETGGVIVGGSGFYLRALAWTHSASDDASVATPPDDPARRSFDERWLAREAEQAGAAHAALGAIDPETAAAVHPRNVVRVLRNLWLCHIHGGPVSRVRRENPPRPRVRLMVLVCDPDPAALSARIEARLDRMLAAGWLQEVEQLVADGYDARHKAMRSLGYRELLEVVAGRMSLGAAREAILHATRQYARRQRTYVRHQLPAEQVIRVVQPQDCPWDRVQAFLRSGPSPSAGGPRP